MMSTGVLTDSIALNPGNTSRAAGGAAAASQCTTDQAEFSTQIRQNNRAQASCTQLLAAQTVHQTVHAVLLRTREF